VHFAVAILAHSVLYTWIHIQAARSLLAAILFHFMINFTGMLVEGAAWVEWTRTVLTIAAALVVVRGWRTAAGRTGSRDAGSLRERSLGLEDPGRRAAGTPAPAPAPAESRGATPFFVPRSLRPRRGRD
jgi:hypothetical protein